MSDLFSHEEQSSDVTTAEKQPPPSGVIFLEPGAATAREPSNHARRAVQR